MVTEKVAGRGPSGAVAFPPEWLNTKSLPIGMIPKGQVVHRIHRAGLDPIFFGPGEGVPPTYRFDSAGGRFGVLYVGVSCRAALAETILRNPQRLTVATADITTRAASELVCSRELRLVAMHGAGLQVVGADNAISTGPYEPCGVWADALWDHPDGPDGIAYLSRHDPSEICIALFERGDLKLSVRNTKRLTAMLKDVAALLDCYGKSLAPAV